MGETPHTLTGRIVVLERMNRLLWLVALGLGAELAYVAARTPASIEARSFRLVDAAGGLRAELTVRGADHGLYLKDADGVDRVAVFLDSTTSGMYVMDSVGTTRIGVAQFSHGGGGVALHGPDSKGAAVLYLKGSGSLRFFDDSGTVTNQVVAEAK